MELLVDYYFRTSHCKGSCETINTSFLQWESRAKEVYQAHRQVEKKKYTGIKHMLEYLSHKDCLGPQMSI